MSKTVTLPYSPFWEPLLWAKEHCPSYITNNADVNSNIVYYFSNEKDALMFLLRWGR